MQQKDFYAGWFALHFLLIISFACWQTTLLVAQGPTIVPTSFKSFLHKTAIALSGARAPHLAASNPIRQAVVTYLHLAGIEVGYGYFAPNVPGSYRLVFELRYPDGRVEYDLPSVSSEAAGLRVAGLLDNIGRTPYDALREMLVKALAQSIWRKHPNVQSIRAILGTVNLPSVNGFEHGERESCQFLYAYDFSLKNEPGRPKNR